MSINKQLVGGMKSGRKQFTIVFKEMPALVHQNDSTVVNIGINPKKAAVTDHHPTRQHPLVSDLFPTPYNPHRRP